MIRPLRGCGRAAFPALTMVLLLGVLSGVARAVEVSDVELENRKCLSCHNRSTLATMKPEERRTMVAPSTQPIDRPAQRPGLYVTPDTLKGSVHAKLACVNCHEEAAVKQALHPAVMKKVSCNSGCHAQANVDYRRGAHAEAAARGDAQAPNCATCHGGHQVLKKDQRASKTFALNVVKVCGECHQKHADATGNGTDKHVGDYLQSVHGRAVEKGLAAAATCADCHGPHKVLPSKNAASSVHPNNVAATCGQGQCHVGVAETYRTSVHGELLAGGRAEAPTCSGCHTSHRITRTDTPDFKLDIVGECGTCHQKEIDTYRESYHGQVTNLDFARAARCSSCHGSHQITRVEAAGSRLHAENRRQTCATGNGAETCHPNAPAGFASFIAHADYRDGQKYPLLHGIWLYFVVMMSFAFGFFGLHSLLWLARSVIERVRHGPHPRHYHTGEKAIQRFNRVDRINHALVIVSFFGLTLTGLPLLYADKAWGRGLMAMLGGVNSAGILHRVFAVMLIANFVIHGVGVLQRIRKHGLFNLLLGPATMLPRWKDVTDCLGMFRWFFRGGKKPAFDRWTYWEKFDYVAEVGGSGIIGVTGLILWFPQFFGSFLPGWVFNAALIIHGYEALLAIGFIFSIHFFNAHLRLEKFPVDDVMFTGRLPEEEFKEERPAEYARAVATGQIEALRVSPPAKAYRTFAVAMGIVAMAIGTTLVALIILAALGVI